MSIQYFFCYIVFVQLFPRSPLHHFLSQITKSVAPFFTKARLSRVQPTKNTYRSRLHPYDATPGVFETKFCENLFDLTNIVCCYETRNVYGMYRNSHDVI